MPRRSVCLFVQVAVLSTLVSPVAFGQWVQFNDQTTTRLSAATAVGSNNPDEKDYAWGDVDQDGDIDLVAVYKEPFTTTGRRRNVLFMNEGVSDGQSINGVLVDRTPELIPQFLDLTNDRDVILVDVNGDLWLDIVTATTLSGSQPKHISHPRVYINRQLDGFGNWLGFIFDDDNRIPAMPVEPRFCAVSAGDIDNDGDQDLYFGDYDQGPYARPADLNDRLWINDGNGYFTDQTALRMTAEMVNSAFGMATAIGDINGDGKLDIVKDSALAFPQRVSVSYNDSDNEGFFDVFDVVYDSAPYHVSIGDLNNDNRLDLVVTDDGSDRYLLNQGNDAGGVAMWLERTFVGTSPNDFGGDQVIADLNNDGFNDVFITDVDVDIPGCTRPSKLYRNLGNLPDVTLQDQGNAGISAAHMAGIHDVAVFDINGDGWKDLVLGRCDGTRVYMNQPPVGLLFAYPSGLPFFVRPDVGTTFLVQVNGQTGVTPQPATGTLFVSVDNGPFNSAAMAHLGDNLYLGVLPAGNCTDRIRFYVRAQSTAGGTFYDPPTAPATTHSAVLAVTSIITLRDEIEGSVAGWTIVNDPSLMSGAWEQADPNGTIFASAQAAPEDDATQGANKVMAFVTGNGAPGGIAPDSDLDGGPTRLISPVIDLAGTDATISYSRWVFSAGSVVQDPLRVEVTNNGSTWTLVETVNGTNGQWMTGSFLVGDFVAPSAQVQVRFSISDSPNDSVTEAGIDNFQVEELSCALCSEHEECDDNNPCTDEFCNHGICELTTNNTPCNDGDVCSVSDVCSVGNCIGTRVPECQPCTSSSECGDGNPCTDDECVGSICQHLANSESCDDNNICTINDGCVQSSCGGDLIPDCQACVTNADCNDGRFCNGVETCDTSNCQPGIRPCEPGQPCDELSDTCTLTLQPRMGDPILGLTPDELARFNAGRAQFERSFLEAEGVGPIFNQNSCGQCHNAGGSGGAGTTVVIRFGRQDKAGFDPLADLGGSLLQAQAISDECRELIPVEANVTAFRVTPPIFGGGLVESIPDADILAGANNPPPGINGMVHLVPAFEDPQGSPLRVGRFGWKAQVATLLTFSADAASNEMGLTNRFLPLENAPNGNSALLAQCDTVPDPEDGPDGFGFHFIDRVADFQRFLAPPPQTPKSGMSGETLFVHVGCAACHKPQFVTGTVVESALSNRTLQPYSDFLLHNMGLLADGIFQGDAPGNFMRTSPLWGVRVRDPLLHDASVQTGSFADRIQQAVARHNLPGSDAAPSAAGFAALLPTSQNAIIAFLDSLGRREFDHDGDGAVDETDFLAFQNCYRNPGTGYTPDDPCALSDVEQDGDVDDEDFALFLQAFDGPLPDCDGNSIVDFQEMLDETADDCDQNASLDACDGFLCNDDNDCTEDSCEVTACSFVANTAACDDGDSCSVNDVCAVGVCAGSPTVVLYGDVSPDTGDGDVDVDDLLCVLDRFSGFACPGADIAPCGGNGVIDVDDLLAELAAFTGDYACPHPCPP